MSNPALKKIVLPIGWNALLNADKKVALIIGEYKYVSEANTALTLLTKPTEAELLAAVPAGYTEFYPPKPAAPKA
jgi:hypothetical protein